MKKGILLALLFNVIYYSSAYLYYKNIIPYSVDEGKFSINNHLVQVEINYNDPDISYRDMEVIFTHISGDPLEITYIKCSDDYKINLTEGSVRFTHNFGGSIYVRLLYENTSASLSYTIIDRTSFFIPKSAAKACTSMPGIVYGVNITLLLFISVSMFAIVYILIYKRELLMTKLKQL